MKPIKLTKPPKPLFMWLYIPSQERPQQKYTSDHAQPHDDGKQAVTSCIHQSQQGEREEDQQQQIKEE